MAKHPPEWLTRLRTECKRSVPDLVALIALMDQFYRSCSNGELDGLEEALDLLIHVHRSESMRLSMVAMTLLSLTLCEPPLETTTIESFIDAFERREGFIEHPFNRALLLAELHYFRWDLALRSPQIELLNTVAKDESGASTYELHVKLLFRSLHAQRHNSSENAAQWLHQALAIAPDDIIKYLAPSQRLLRHFEDDQRFSDEDIAMLALYNRKLISARAAEDVLAPPIA